MPFFVSFLGLTLLEVSVEPLADGSVLSLHNALLIAAKKLGKNLQIATQNTKKNLQIQLKTTTTLLQNFLKEVLSVEGIFK